MANFESGARAALRQAFVARDEVAGRVEATKSAFARIEDQLFEAWKRLREVRAHAGEDERDEVAALIASGSATVLERVNGRATIAEIEREVDELKAARESCRGALREVERDLEFADCKVVSAIGNVLASAAPTLIASCAAAKVDFTAKASLLRFLRSSLSDACRRKVDEAVAYPLSFDDVSSPLLEAWKSAAAALAEDSDAPLPE